MRYPGQPRQSRPKTIALASLAIFLPCLLYLTAESDAQTMEPSRGKWIWQKPDHFDKFMAEFNSINLFNCLPNMVKTMQADTLSQIPRFNRILQDAIFSNRTRMLHLHNQVLSRSFFYAYIYQRLNQSEFDFSMQPGMLYYYLSAVADVTANPDTINSSALYFDPDTMYANWYKLLTFNNTLSLFAPRAYRFENTLDPYNWLREPTNDTIQVTDMSVGIGRNYSDPSNGFNPVYSDSEMGINFLPDIGVRQQVQSGSAKKFAYSARLKFSSKRGDNNVAPEITIEFFGPPYPGQKDDFLPVRFTKPYFDCGWQNRWVYSSVSPIVDFMPRYSSFNHIRRSRFVGIAVMDTELIRHEINPCPISQGNGLPNRFADTCRCKLDTTSCEPLPSRGLARRGGYQCMCKPGYRYPSWQQGPYQGVDIEQASEDEYAKGFYCEKIRWQQVPPMQLHISVGAPLHGDESVLMQKNRTKRSLEVRENILQVKKITAEDAKSMELSEIIESMEAAQKSINASIKVIDDQSFSEIISDRESSSSPESSLASIEEQMDISIPIETKLAPEIIGAALEKGSKHLRDEALDSKEWKSRPEIDHRTDQGLHLKKKKRYRRDLGYVGKQGDLDKERFKNVLELMKKKNSITPANCKTFPPEELILPGDVSFGASSQFDNQARSALRIAHFLSAYLQNVQPFEAYGDYKGDPILNEELLFGEVLSNVMGDPMLLASGIFFERDAFVQNYSGVVFEPPFRKEFFGPFAYKRYDFTSVGSSASGTDNSGSNTQTPSTFYAVDANGWKNGYEFEPWFWPIREQWGSNVYGLKRYLIKPLVRTNLQGSQLKRFEHFPIYAWVPKITDGIWTPPYFDCNHLNAWVVTYSVPFFGLDFATNTMEFRGVVSATVFLDLLDIYQCPQPFYMPNIFKNTAACDFESTYCVAVGRRGFSFGGYKCECRQGYEYRFKNDDRVWYFDGSTMHAEYIKMITGEKNMYSILTCREAGAALLQPNVAALLAALVVAFSLVSRGW